MNLVMGPVWASENVMQMHCKAAIEKEGIGGDLRAFPSLIHAA